MLQIVHDWLNEKWDETGLSLEKIRNRIIEKHPEQSISISKLHRIFSDPNCKVSIEEILQLAEAFDSDPNVLFAKIGGREYEASKDVDYKGAETLIHEFNEDRERTRQEYDLRIAQSIEARKETQKAFEIAIHQIEEQYRKNADYLTGIIRDNEAYIRDLLVKTADANSIASAAQKRAEESEKAREKMDRRRHQVFWGMLSVILLLVGMLIFIMVADVPMLGGGNM